MRLNTAYWQRVTMGCVIASLIVVFVFDGGTISTPPSKLAQAFAVSFLFSMCIAPITSLAMPIAAPWLWRRTTFPFNWIAICVLLTALAVIGSTVAIMILVGIGYLPPRHFGDWFASSVRVSIALTLTVGIFITISESYRSRLKEATTASQLASLEARVQPHFLFNTLNSIAELIHEDPRGAERMTGQLASLLRSSLDQQATPLVSLEDELKTVRDYLAIEKVRFGDRLRYSIDADPSTSGANAARVPRMSVQTLVENSVKYAVTPRPHGAALSIRAANAPRAITITVDDDGPGFDASHLPDGHGLALLRDRLHLLFRDRDRLTIESSASGTRVTMTLPHVHDVPAS
jgi:signal transduction histidine kinase